MAAKTPTIDALPDVFLICRVVGHAWMPRVTYVETIERRQIHRCVWVCEREAIAGVPDPTERETISLARGAERGGLFTVPAYKYAAGYLVAEHLGRGAQRPTARYELMGRLVNGRRRRR